MSRAVLGRSLHVLERRLPMMEPRYRKDAVAETLHKKTRQSDEVQSALKAIVKRQFKSEETQQWELRTIHAAAF
jgi:hypothetical protein